MAQAVPWAGLSLIYSSSSLQHSTRAFNAAATAFLRRRSSLVNSPRGHNILTNQRRPLKSMLIVVSVPPMQRSPMGASIRALSWLVNKSTWTHYQPMRDVHLSQPRRRFGTVFLATTSKRKVRAVTNQPRELLTPLPAKLPGKNCSFLTTKYMLNVTLWWNFCLIFGTCYICSNSRSKRI